MNTRIGPPAKTARLFVTGGSQAVRLPAEFRFEGAEVLIHRDPRSGDVVLSPVVRKSWAKVEQNGATPRALLTRGYQHDLAGNITRIDSDAGATDYGYDPLGRLTQAAPDQALQAKGLPQEQYGYDAVGNRTSSAHQAGAWSYNADNQLIQYPKTTPFSATPAVDTQVSYTPQGHTKEETNSQGTRTFSYNAAERLSELSQGSATVRYRYDPFGRRISKSVTQGGSTQTTYFLNGDSALMAEADGNGQITRAYGFNPNTQSEEQDLWSTDPLWQAELGGKTSLSDAAFHYVATDHLGTPILATDKQGNKSWRGHSEAFGNTGVDGGSAIQMNLRFPGQYYDRETNLHQNWFRDYSPGLGRYAQTDPLGLYGDFGLYGYANQNPGYFYDPYGLFGVRDALGILPVVGSGLDAYDAFRCGNYGRAGLNLGLAMLDATGVGALVKGFTVGTMKWSQRALVKEAYKTQIDWNHMRRQLQKEGVIPRNSKGIPRKDWQTTDHVFIKQREGRPHEITNHPANLQVGVKQSLNSKFEHMNILQRSLYLPSWMKLAGLGFVSYGAGLFVGPGCECD